MNDRNQFEKWVALHVGDGPPNFSGRQHGYLWMYDDSLIELFWMCWKAAQSAKV